MYCGLVSKGTRKVVTAGLGQRRLCKFTNCSIVKKCQIRKDDLWVREGKVVDPEKVFFDERASPDSVVDMEGALLAPGLIDIQVNGGFGVDFTSEYQRLEECVAQVGRGLVGLGVTGFCPTLVTSGMEVYREATMGASSGGLARRPGGKEDGAAVLGFHFEGPFISPRYKGVHSEQFIRELGSGVETLLEVYGDLSKVSVVTLAPEKCHAGDVIEHLAGLGVVASIGHSAATLEESLEGVRRGASLVTHMFNGMAPFKPREPGLLGLLTASEVKFCLIADGVHSHPSSLRLGRSARPGGVVLVSDGVSPMGLPSGGEHRLGGRKVEVVDGSVYTADDGGERSLAGSATPLIECVRRYVRLAGASVAEALEAASTRPAEVLGLDNKGRLEPGLDADFIALDDDLNLASTWISGICVYRSQNN